MKVNRQTKRRDKRKTKTSKCELFHNGSSRRKKLSRVGTETWQISALKRKTGALVHVGSGVWLNAAAARRTWRRMGDLGNRLQPEMS
jgi:hypothetical protein